MTHQIKLQSRFTLPDPPATYDPLFMRHLIGHLNERFDDAARSGDTEEYSTTNVTETRTFDADSTTVEELADVLGTIIEALQHKGIIP